MKEDKKRAQMQKYSPKTYHSIYQIIPESAMGDGSRFG
jgi:hypothetical protein